MKGELLRFTTAGSVDDGKSTLIGRLLYDSKSIFQDQLASIEATSKKKGLNEIDFSLLTDGLKDEREQGITIDVAYRYFNTPNRKFIIADTPGHIQYTRNMVTGASTANAALILIDARNGVVEQTKRHSYIASLLQIPHVLVCINKMDLVQYDETKFEEIKEQYKDFAAKLDIQDFDFIPISALKGDNVVNRSKSMDWYNGPTLLHSLENIPVANDLNHIDFRFPVQTVLRPHTDEYHDYRGYAGRISSGIIRVGDEITTLPSQLQSKIKKIHCADNQLQEAYAPQSISIELEDDIDISRGDMIVKTTNQPQNSQEIDAMICWMGENPMLLNGKYGIQHTSRTGKSIVKEILYKLDLDKLKRLKGKITLMKNDIARIKIRTTTPLFFDSYRKNRNTGSFILIDETNNNTVGAGMII
ncbi:MAG: GTP-binding protein [Crocinitomicaceae bacterium]|tara:strand:- start:586 stop:1833 length:1248 start_codon:yes stop_codon:yes gene_type:complete